MYNLSDIQSKFFTDKLLTFKSSLNSSTSKLDSDLTGISKSNRYFNQGVHPLITLENIEAMLPLLSGYTISAYEAGTTYGNYNSTFSLTDIVTSSSKYYISIASSNVGHTPSSSPTYWKETTLLSLILKDKIRSSIETVLSNLLIPNFIEENRYIYRVANTVSDLIENTDKFVGYRIFPTTSDHLLFLINQIGLHFEENETITMYLYNQNKLVSTFDVTATSNLFEWKDITTLEINSNSGAWYLFYDQKELDGRAIGNNTVFYNYVSTWANITPFEMTNVTDLPNITSSNLVYDKNFGLNLNFSISYDLTNFVKQHLVQFAECFQRQFEYDILSMFMYNSETQSNRTERNLMFNKTDLGFELKSFEGDTVVKKLASAMKRMKATIEKLGYKDSSFEENEKDAYTVGSI